MAFNLTDTTTHVSKQTNLTPNIVMRIKDIDLLIGPVHVEVIPNFDEDDPYLFDDGLFFDKPARAKNSRALIDGGQGTTRTLQQQLLQDKGGTGSVSTFTVKVLDKDGEITRAIQTGTNINDILSAEAEIFYGYKGTTFPDDFYRVFAGLISDYMIDAGAYYFQISDTSQYLRQRMFVPATGVLTSAIDDTVTTIPVDSTADLIDELSGTITPYLIIGNEAMQITGKTPTSLTVIRSQLKTLPLAHDIDTEYQSLYRLQGQPIELGLQLMLSNSETAAYATELVSSFNILNATTTVSNAIFFRNLDINNEHNITTGDTVTITGSVNPANDGTHTILTIVKVEDGSYITVDATLIDESVSTASADFISQYNIMPAGADLQMKPKHVDIAKHLSENVLFGSTFPALDIYLKEEITGKELIHTEIFFPVGLYYCPRGAAASVAMTSPPIATDDVPVLNTSNIVNSHEVRISRSINKNFYNSVIYKLEEDSIEDKFKFNKVTYSADSPNRIKAGNLPLVIEAKGFRRGTITDNYLVRQTNRFLDRFKFGAEVIKKVRLLPRFANLEIADIVVFDGNTSQLADLNKGTRTYAPRLMEITQKKQSLLDGTVEVQLTSTAFSLDGRYAVVSPSSYTNSNSTVSRLCLDNTVDTGEFLIERDKWSNFIGQNVRVHSADYTDDETVQFTGFDSTNQDCILISPDLSFTPSNHTVEVPIYDDSSDTAMEQYKIQFAFFDPQVVVTTSIDSISFDCDVSRLFVGAVLQIHNDDFTRDSVERKIDDITGTTITLDEALSFTPLVGDILELIGFLDEGLPYRII